MTSIEENSTLNASEKAANEFYNWKNKITDVEEEEDDLYGIDNLIIIILCAGGLAMALAGFLLWPFTMIATALLHNEIFSGNYYLTWLNAELLVTLWDYAFIGCNISLFGLLPFAFFYSETDQLRTFFAKARETLTIMLLVGMLIRLPLRPNYRRSLKEKLKRYKMDITVWRQRLENLDRGLRSISMNLSNSRNEIIAKINKLEEEEKLLLSHFIWLLILGHILYALMKSLLVDDGKDLENLEALIATIIGVYSISPFEKIRPRLGKMTVQQIIANVTVLLVISSSWPALVRVLGLTRLNSAGPYENFSTMINIGYHLAMAFRIGTLITTVFSTLEYYVLRMIRNPSHNTDGISRRPYNHSRFYQSQRDRNTVETNLNGYFFHHSPPDHHGMRR
ncbi:protein LMBR1L isoform X1 [Rhizophagus clarus]|uniref:Protein LMBR1L isoform X1 n=1 Tax=Rhizophagus clarus TaxID=94130 RepID=A0A8H3QC03_9GLOM|nr:protein LMBR1L isoform X1 [Rhizophagus clarus]